MQSKPRHPVWRLLREYAWRYRWSYAAGVVFLWLTNDLTARIPLAVGSAVDALTAGGSVTRQALAVAAMGVGVIAVRTLSRVLIFNPGRDLELHLRQDLFEHLLRLPAGFYAHHPKGDLVSRASNDIRLIRAMVGFGGLQVVNVAFAVTITGYRMVQVDPGLTAAVAPLLLGGLAVVFLGIRRLFDLQRTAQEQLGGISSHILATIQGLSTVRGFAAEPAFEGRLEAKNRAWFATALRLTMIRSLVLPFLTLAGAVALAVVLLVGGRSVLRGELTVGGLAAYVALLAALLPPLRSLGWLMAVLQRGRAALERVFEVLDSPAEDRGLTVLTRPGRRGPPTIEVRGLHFTYPGAERPALADISATLEPGAVVGLFGRSGAGKTTLLRLLALLERPPAGSLFAEGEDLAAVAPGSWRRRIVLVEQRPFLFSDTVAANIALSDDPDPHRLRWAVRLAALEPDLAALPRGLDTVVGERGVMLSGGQRQRVALARALYRGGEVVLLDDIVSAVDHATERRLVEAVAGLSTEGERPTVVVASHRLSVLRHAHTILVLEGGRLTARGTHAELVERPGPYREAWLLQQLGRDPELEAAAGGAA